MTTFRTRDVHLLVGAAGLSALGDLALAIPLALEVRAKSGSALAVSLFFLCMFGPIVLLAGVAGRLVDRVENRRLLICVSLAQAAATSLLLLADSPVALLVLTAVIGSGLAVVAPAEFSLIPVAAGEERVAAANGRVEAARYLGMTAGPVLGGLLASSGRFHAAVLLNAGSFLAVALAGAALRARRHPAAPARGERRRARDGLAALVADRSLRIVLATGGRLAGAVLDVDDGGAVLRPRRAPRRADGLRRPDRRLDRGNGGRRGPARQPRSRRHGSRPSRSRRSRPRAPGCSAPRSPRR